MVNAVRKSQPITLGLYFRMLDSEVEKWKAAYFGFTYIEKDNGSMFSSDYIAHFSEDFPDWASFQHNVEQIEERFKEQLGSADLVRIEVLAPSEFFRRLEEIPVLNKYNAVKYKLDGYAFKRSSEIKNLDTHCKFKTVFDICVPAKDEFKRFTEFFNERVKEEKGIFKHSISFTEDGHSAVVRDVFLDATALIDHLRSCGDIFAALLTAGNIDRMEIHAPESQLKALRLEPILEACGCEFYESDNKGTDDDGNPLESEMLEDDAAEEEEEDSDEEEEMAALALVEVQEEDGK